MANIHLEIGLNESKTLQNSLDESAYLDITSLKIKGRLTIADINLLSEFKNLQILDLSSANPYYNSQQGDWSTQLSEMPSLERIIIPTSVSYIMDNVFDKCIALKEIKGKSNDFRQAYGYKYYTKDGVFYKKDFNGNFVVDILIKYPICKDEKQFILDCDQVRNCAFKNAKLKTIVSKRHDAPLCGNNAFEGVDVSKVLLLVPKGSYYNYKYAKVWKDFLIKEWDVTEPQE